MINISVAAQRITWRITKVFPRPAKDCACLFRSDSGYMLTSLEVRELIFRVGFTSQRPAPLLLYTCLPKGLAGQLKEFFWPLGIQREQSASNKFIQQAAASVQRFEASACSYLRRAYSHIRIGAVSSGRDR